ncbi:MAG: S41 family peptidase [Candidatus Krumholzibacteriia bacterium]
MIGTNRTVRPPEAGPSVAMPFAWRLAACLLLAASVLTPLVAGAQVARPGQLPALDPATRAAVLDSLAAVIDSVYVLAEPATRIVAGLRRNLAEGVYDELADPAELAARLERDCQEINHDGHFAIAALPPRDPEVAAAGRQRDPADIARDERRDKARNYGFRQAEILPGGIGYLRFDRFADGGEAFVAAAAAMNFLANSEAVILDLRHNGGGNASMIRLLCGYLFAESTHLINWDIRAEGQTVQSYSLDYVPGKRLVDQPVYVLVSGHTFSAAEEFTFDLKHLERATIVGETTGGGGHTVASYTFDFDGFRMGIRVPYGRAYDPKTNQGWEGVGIRPDIEVPADQALEAARADALRKLMEREEDQEYKAGLQWVLTDLESRLSPLAVSGDELRQYVGVFGPREVMLQDGELFYRRGDGPLMKLTPMGPDLFRVGDLDYFRARFERDDDDRVVRFIGLYDDGREDVNDRSEG